MAGTINTTNYNFKKYAPDDTVSVLQTFNGNMDAIDKAIKDREDVETVQGASITKLENGLSNAMMELTAQIRQLAQYRYRLQQIHVIFRMQTLKLIRSMPEYRLWRTEEVRLKALILQLHSNMRQDFIKFISKERIILEWVMVLMPLLQLQI